MDFWSRLLHHTPLSTSIPRRDHNKDPARRLHRFEKIYSDLLQKWRIVAGPSINNHDVADRFTRDHDFAEELEVRLQELTTILLDETRRPLPHPCIQYADVRQMYTIVGQIAVAASGSNEWIVNEAVRFFAALIESEEGPFVEQIPFSKALTTLLVKITGVNGARLGQVTEGRVVELAFNIATKIRLQPGILRAWFRADQHANQIEDMFTATPPQNLTRVVVHSPKPGDGAQRFAGRSQKNDFPLFYILLDYIHHEGKVGDFARTGLLYVIESASAKAAVEVELEQWIVESDLSTLMATGLGALYSQLSRKLVIDHCRHSLPAVLALSDFQHSKGGFDAVSSCEDGFLAHMDTFLSHLLFWQDVLNHCGSVDVKKTLLEHFQVIFLQQLLYPSLLESSDIDGGSSVAVLTYLRRILESLDRPDMIDLILHYLLALPPPTDSAGPPSPIQSSVSDARKRKSMDLQSMLASQHSADPSATSTATPLLFNLVDLVLASLRSYNQQTILVTLQLVSAILKRHHPYAVATLLRTAPAESAKRTAGAHLQEVEFLIGMAAEMGGDDGNLNSAYDSILRDSTTRVEGHSCSVKLIVPHLPIADHDLSSLPEPLPGALHHIGTHTLHPSDPLLSIMLDHLANFFVNPVETNLSLTETIVDLAVCGFMTIEGWLVRSPQKYTYDEGNEDGLEGDEDIREDDLMFPLDPDSPPYSSPHSEHQRLRSVAMCQRRPHWTSSSLPRISQVLRRLTDQTNAYRDSIPRFEDLLQQRREAFMTADAATTARASTPTPTAPRQQQQQKQYELQQHTPERPSSESASRSESPVRLSALEGFAQRILQELGTPSRSGSPRSWRDWGRRSGEHGQAAGHGNELGAHSRYYHRHGNPQSGGRGRSSPTLAAAAAAATTASADASAAKPQRISSHGALGHAPPGPTPPPQFPFPASHDSPVVRGQSPGMERGTGGPRNLDRINAIEAQAAAFAAIDQEILARRVGLPRRPSPHPHPHDGDGKQVNSERGNNTSPSMGMATVVGKRNPSGKEEEEEEEGGEEEEEEKEEGEEALDSDAGPIPIDFGRKSEGKEVEVEEVVGKVTADPAAAAVGSDGDGDGGDGDGDDGPRVEGHDGSFHDGGGEPEPAAASPAAPPEEEAKTVSVSHVLTNVIVLQSFLLELAALVQVRAGLFGEVRYSW